MINDYYIRFFEETGFPGVIGSIDGTHIAIFPPQTEREHLFINRKLYHSLNVMIVCIKIVQYIQGDSK